MSCRLGFSISSGWRVRVTASVEAGQKILRMPGNAYTQLNLYSAVCCTACAQTHLHICTAYTHTHTHIHARTHTFHSAVCCTACAQTHLLIYTAQHTHTHTRTYTHTHTHTHIPHTHTHTHVHTQTHAPNHARTHPCTCA
jgi:hypothetical protein